MIDVIGWVLMTIGAFGTLAGAVGLHRFPDPYARLHVAGSATTLGAVPTLLGAALVVGGGGAAKLLLAAVFLLVTTPAATQALGGAAARSGTEAAPDTRAVSLEEGGLGHVLEDATRP